MIPCGGCARPTEMNVTNNQIHAAKIMSSHEPDNRLCLYIESDKIMKLLSKPGLTLSLGSWIFSWLETTFKVLLKVEKSFTIMRGSLYHVERHPQHQALNRLDLPAMRHTVNIPIVNILSSHNDRLLHGLTCFLNLQSRRWKKEIPIINMLFTWAAAIGESVSIPCVKTANQFKKDSKNNKLELGRVESTNEASQTQFHQMWSLFRRKAKEHDYALIEAWREDCNVVMIFVCRFFP